MTNMREDYRNYIKMQVNEINISRHGARNAKNTKDFAPLRETKMPDRVLKVQERPEGTPSENGISIAGNIKIKHVIDTHSNNRNRQLPISRVA